MQVQDESSRRDHMLGACHPYGDHGYVKICLKERLSHSGVWGSNLQDLTKQSAIKESGLCARQRYALIG